MRALPLRFLSALALLLFATHAHASESQTLVDRAKLTAQSMLQDQEMGAMRQVMKRAKGVLIVPSLVKAGFVVGGEGGDGVLLARNPDGSWSNPAFCLLLAGSVGLQIGVQEAEVVFVIMTDKAMNAMLRNEVKLGGDVGIAVGPVGIGYEASSAFATTGVDIYAFTRAKGLFAGGALEGSVIRPRRSYNAQFYGNEASSQQILQGQSAPTAGANELRETLSLFN